MTLTGPERQHAESILTPATLAPIPPKQVSRILVGAVVRKPKVVLDAFYRSLLWQQAPGTQIDYALIHNWPAGDPEEAEGKSALAAFGPGININVSDSPAPAGDYAATNGTSRGWTPQAWHRVGALKNNLIQRALSGGYDYLWLVDADVLCDPTTLASLLACRSPIVSGVYWTQWTKPRPGDAQVQHAGPQVWLRHPYQLSGRGWSEASFRAALIDRSRVRVWGLGACTLISRAALEKGAHFGKFAELPPGPMSDGEDRHFCLRADALHLEMHADGWPDIWHAYHPDDYSQIPARMAALERPHRQRPALGDVISARVTNLEMPGLSPQWVRGQLGKLRLLPELEERIMSLDVGGTATFKAHFPSHWPLENLRNQNLILRVELLDAKPFGFPPTIDKELFVGGLSKAYMDQTTLTEAACQEIAADANAIQT